MDKYLLLSVLLAQVLLPAAFAGDPLPRRGLKRAVTAMICFNLAYLAALFVLYPLLVDPASLKVTP